MNTRRRLFQWKKRQKQIKSGDTVITALGIGACSADMYHAILNRHKELQGVNMMDAVQVRPCKLYDPEFMGWHRRPYQLHACLRDDYHPQDQRHPAAGFLADYEFRQWPENRETR